MKSNIYSVKKKKRLTKREYEEIHEFNNYTNDNDREK